MDIMFPVSYKLQFYMQSGRKSVLRGYSNESYSFGVRFKDKTSVCFSLQIFVYWRWNINVIRQKSKDKFVSLQAIKAYIGMEGISLLCYVK